MELTYRLATVTDIPAIIQLLTDDALGATREQASTSPDARYLNAFNIIASDPHQELTVVEMTGTIVATFQLSFIQYLTHTGTRRAQVEAVRTHAAYRGQGIGKKVFEYIANRAREKGCGMLQLTTDKRRPEAIRFYESLGFIASHEGMKLVL